MRYFKPMFLGMLISFAVSGCDLFTQSGLPVDPIDPQALQLLLEADWELFAWGTPEFPQGLLDGTRITLKFSGEGDGTSGTLGGSAGCNTYSASYSITASAIELGPAILTRMFCGEPEGVMDQENRFVQALGSIVGYELAGGQFDMIYGVGGERLFFIGALP